MLAAVLERIIVEIVLLDRLERIPLIFVQQLVGEVRGWRREISGASGRVEFRELPLLWPPTHRPQGFTLSPLDLRGIGATAALEVKVLTNCVVKQAH